MEEWDGRDGVPAEGCLLRVVVEGVYYISALRKEKSMSGCLHMPSDSGRGSYKIVPEPGGDSSYDFKQCVLVVCRDGLVLTYYVVDAEAQEDAQSSGERLKLQSMRGSCQNAKDGLETRPVMLRTRCTGCRASTWLGTRGKRSICGS